MNYHKNVASQIIEYLKDGNTQAEIASEMDISQQRVSKILKAENKNTTDATVYINSEGCILKNEPPETKESNHRKKEHSPLSPIQQKEHSQKEGTLKRRNIHYHKDVRQQILDLLQDGLIRKTSEIQQGVTASARAIGKSLNAMSKAGDIEKVGYGKYRIARKDDQSPSKDEKRLDKPAQPVYTEPVDSRKDEQQPAVDTARSVDKQPPAKVTRKGYNKMKIDASKDDTCFSNPPPAVDKGSDKDDNGQDTDPVDKQPPARKDDKKGKLREALRKDDKPPSKDATSSGNRAEQNERAVDNEQRQDARPPVDTDKTTDYKDTVSVWIEPAGCHRARIFYGSQNRLADLRLDTVQSIPEQALTEPARLEIKIDEMEKIGFEICFDDPSLDGNPRAEADRKAKNGT